MISSATLQLIAIISMTIDHVGFYLFPDFVPLRCIGRLAFPLFAFLLVEGFRYTKSWRRYYMRLFYTAVITQIISFFLSKVTHTPYSYNVVFTFCFALLSLVLSKKGGACLVLIPILALIAGVFDCDYGVYGVFLIIGLYYTDRFFSDSLVLLNLSRLLILIAMMLPLAQYNNWPIQNFAIAAIFPIMLYSGKKGTRLSRIFRYAYYPAHLLLILIVKLVFN